MTIQEYFKRLEIENTHLDYSITYNGYKTKDKWTGDSFTFAMNDFQIEYTMGIGLRKVKKTYKTNNVPTFVFESHNHKQLQKLGFFQVSNNDLYLYFDIRPNKDKIYYLQRTTFYSHDDYALTLLMYPTIQDIFYSFASDFQCVNGYTFEEFCLNMGYDTDSRKAEKIYNDILQQSNKLSSIIPYWDELKYCTEDEEEKS